MGSASFSALAVLGVALLVISALLGAYPAAFACVIGLAALATVPLWRDEPDWASWNED